MALDPLHEPAHRLLLALYAWSGQRAAALRQYRECGRILGKELGVAPLEETTGLYQSVQENDPPPPPVLSDPGPSDSQVARGPHPPRAAGRAPPPRTRP